MQSGRAVAEPTLPAAKGLDIVGWPLADSLRQFSKSHSVEMGDALIAAAVHDLELWNRNRRHYPMKDISFCLA